jgi:hypothetical protein
VARLSALEVIALFICCSFSLFKRVSVQRAVLARANAGFGGSLSEIVRLFVPLDTRVGWYLVKLDWDVIDGCFGEEVKDVL